MTLTLSFQGQQLEYEWEGRLAWREINVSSSFMTMAVTLCDHGGVVDELGNELGDFRCRRADGKSSLFVRHRISSPRRPIWRHWTYTNQFLQLPLMQYMKLCFQLKHYLW